MQREVHAVRTSAAFVEASSIVALRVRGPGAFEALDRVVAADLYVRNGHLRHTLVLDPEGHPIADCYVCNDDDEYVLLAHGMTAEALAELVRAPRVEVTDLSERYASIGLHGPFAWEVLSVVEGASVGGIPYLSFYRGREGTLVFRAGNTGEYGYEVLVPKARRDAVVGRLLEVGKRFDLVHVTEAALSHCALENCFFDARLVERCNTLDLTPIELQLQWRISSAKAYRGGDAVRARKSALRQRVTAVRSTHALRTGDEVRHGDRVIGAVLDAERSLTLGDSVGLALLDLPYAHSGIDRYTANGAPLRTVSAPFVNNLSSYVNPQRHSYAARHEIAFPGADRT